MRDFLDNLREAFVGLLLLVMGLGGVYAVLWFCQQAPR